MTRSSWPIWLCGILLAICSGVASAHKPSDSYLQLQLDGRQLTGHWDIALRDLDLVLALDLNKDSAIDWGELRQRRDQIAELALSHLALSGDGQSCSLSTTDLLVDHHTDGAYAVLMLDGTCSSAPATIDVRYTFLFESDAQHRGLLRFELAGDPPRVFTAVFPKERPDQHFEIAHVPAWQSLGGFISDGIHHIAVGYDHILFLVALLLPAVMRRQQGRWIPVESLRTALTTVAATVTAFTAAHSITLSLATLGWVSLPSRLIESAIALSVLLTAVDNLVPFLPRRRWQVAFVFGLLHGFGFASVLRDLGLPNSQLFMSLLGFNVGVEIGQLGLVACLIPVAFACRRRKVYDRWALGGGSSVIALLAVLWLLERSLGLNLMPA